MSPAAAVRDAKAGWCSTCRRGAHALCAAPGCECHRMGEAHPNRPEPGARPRAIPPAPAPASSAKPAKPAKAKKVEPVWELVKEDPPAPPPIPKKLTPAERVQPFLEAIAEADDKDWHRVVIFGTPHAAGRAKAALAKEFADGWEWKAARDSEQRPAVFVRMVVE